jgi:hypothetical protein
MLLQLLEHHKDLLKVAIGPPNRHKFAALLLSCRSLYNFIIELPEFIHMKNLQPSLVQICSMNIINSEYVSVREYKGGLIAYSSFTYDRYRNVSPNDDDILRLIVWSAATKKLYVLAKNTHKITVSCVESCDGVIGVNTSSRIPLWLEKYVTDGIIKTIGPFGMWTFCIQI